MIWSNLYRNIKYKCNSRGIGGLDGLSSGVVSSTVAATKLINWGYSGVGVFSPYRSFIMREA